MATTDKLGLELRLPEEPESPSERIRVLDRLTVLAKRWKFIAKFVGAAAVLALIVSFILPNTYTATATLMPPQQSQSAGVAAMLSQLGALGGLAGQNLGLRNPNEVYVSLLKSRTIADALVDRFSLMSVYHTKYREDARKRLASASEIAAGKDGVISISVDDRDALRSAQIANAYVEELQKLTKTLAVTEASRRRLFFEGEMKKASDDLAVSEEALKVTQEKTGLILLDSQSRAMIEMITSLRARVAAQEATVQAMQTYATPNNPELIRAQQELIALRDQVAKVENGEHRKEVANVPLESVPTAGLEYLRKYRDLKYHEALYELLAKQYEAARIDEGRDAVVIQQIDQAVQPERKSWPHRALLSAAVALLAFIIAILLTFAFEAYERAKEDPAFTSRLQLIGYYLRGKG